MKFVDEIVIKVISGNGGYGCVSFKRERFLSKGGPDGGNGGQGGNIVLKATCSRNSLYHIRPNSHFIAGNGQRGGRNKKTGKNGEDFIIEVPIGTTVSDIDENLILFELINNNNFFVLAKGGRGGYGNSKFKSSINKSPKFAQPGKIGITKNIKLDFKILSNIGVIGFPNVGKTSLLNVITSSNSKIGNYSFTTLYPNFGTINFDDSKYFIVVDIPGLIKGSNKGLGLGFNFLRHIERSNIIIHVVDVTQIDLSKVFIGVDIINNELSLYSKNILNKPCIIVLNKIDLLYSNQIIRLFKKECEYRGYDCLAISTKKFYGISSLVSKIKKLLLNF